MANTIQGTWGLDINPLRQAAKGAEKVMQGAGKRVAGFITAPMAQVGAAVGAFFTYETFKSGIQGVIEAGTAMVRMRAQTGMAIGSLAMLKALSMQTDTDFSSLAGSVSKMQRNLFNAAKGGGPMLTTLGLLKLNVSDVVKMKPEEQFKAIGAAIAEMHSPMERAAASMAIFGRSGAELLPLFEQIGSTDFGKLSERAKLLEKDAESFHKITIAFRQAQAGMQSVFIGMADQLVPALLALGKLLASRNALHFGERVGKGISDAVDTLVGAFKNPFALVDPLSNALVACMLGAGNVLIAGLKACGEIFSTGFVKALASIGDILMGTLMRAFAKPIAFLQAGVEKAMETAAGTGGRTPAEEAKLAGMKVGQDALFAKLKELKSQEKNFTPGMAASSLALSGAGGGSLSTLTESIKSVEDSINIQAHQMAELEAKGKFETIADKMARIEPGLRAGIMGDGMTANQYIARGTAGVKVAFVGLADQFKNFKIPDTLGAGAYIDAAKKGLAPLTKAGAKTLEQYKPKETRPAFDPFASRFGGFVTYAKNMLQSASLPNFHNGPHVQESWIDMHTPYNRTSILSARERRGFVDAGVARGEVRPASIAGAYGAVRRGDHLRQRQFAREQMKQKLGLDRTNQLLEGIKNGVDEFNGD